MKKLRSVLLVVALTMVFNNTVVNMLTSTEKREEHELTIAHYVMMGMNGRGGYSYEDDKFSGIV